MVIITIQNDSNFINGVRINKALTINAVNCTISGSNLVRVFIIEGNVVLNNMSFVNATSEDTSGGAIRHNSGSLEINDCVFDNCQSTTWNGGAIQSSTNLIVKRSKFNNTRARSGGGNGGAILSLGSLTIEDCSFNNASAFNKGGALYSEGTSLTVKNSTFNNNNNAVTGFSTGSWNGGGAIYAQAMSTISNSNFVHNRVSDATTHQYPYGGGALYLGGNSAGSTITDCIFDSNIARFGGVSIHGGSGTYSDCLFINNYATDQVG